MAFCSSCGAQVDEGAAFCPSCGKTTGQPSTGSTTVVPSASAGTSAGAGLTDNVAGMLAYITIIPAIVFLVLEPYNKRPFIRFHCFQCLFLAVAAFALGVVLSIIGMIPVLGLVVLFVAPIVWLGVLVLVIVCLLKAYQGQMWKLPVIGDMAEKQANVVSA